ncbi:MAG: pyridoxamine 5'-phosphate oxidase [Thiotrichales bacterium]|nr:pyridoxamine 5'-phosphate oxidase [Thiotrichales bacterium]
MPNRDYHSERREYNFASLDRDQIDINPFEQFTKWMSFAHQEAEIKDPTAMSVTTVDAEGQPHSRVVLLKEFSASGFVFYTNYNSAKAHELANNAKAALLFFWPELDRQIRIEGTISKIDSEKSKAYFHSRPRGSQLAALISEQSEVVADRATLEQRLQQAETTYQDQEIPAPTNWGGYQLKANLFEFWQGRPNRLHDRFRYLKQGEDWKIDRLCP